MPRPPLLIPRLVSGLLGMVLVGASVPALLSGPAGAEPRVDDGSDWGPRGALTSDSAVTVRWDNVDNPRTSVVHRDGRQRLAYTDGKTYDDINSRSLAAYDAHFGPGNGFGGLSVTVSQTEDLLNQAVTINFRGADPDLPGDGRMSRSYFQVFQCWGAPGPDGSPDLDASDPDPQTCQVGGTGADSVGDGSKREYRVVGQDPLIVGGDWHKYLGTTSEVPFLAITGERSGPNLSNDNAFFNRTTTNELVHVTLPESGATTRQFELQTGAESRGTGCGRRADAVSTPTCWLVVVPRVEGVDEALGPISPSVWAQRLQVKLGFRDIVVGCTSGQSRSLLGGSEMLATAAAAWTPGLCTDERIALGYSRYGDQVARNQYVSGASDALVTTRPVPAKTAAVHAPVALTAPVIAYNIDYRPVCDDLQQRPSDASTDAEARACGYADLDELRADLARTGEPVRDLRLNARLVAKLLTQSYQDAIMGCGGTCVSAVNAGTLPRWAVERPTSLTDDPEFRALNPHLHLKRHTGLSDVMVEAMRSDAASQVWQWLLDDVSSASFLAGCPDMSGVTVNPFYSSRTYEGCEYLRARLAREADADRAATRVPDGFPDNPVSYPPDGSPFALPQWQEERQGGSGAERPARTLVDQFPRVDTMEVGARNAFIGYRPRNSDWCATVNDVSCLPEPGKYKDPKTIQPFGDRQLLALTDAPSAARFRLPTARLCDELGEACVGADTAALTAAAEHFVATDVKGVRKPAPDNDYAAGAYPLAMPVYAAVRPTLPAATRNTYADALAYLTTHGQKPGFGFGDLPPGYAPLPKAMRVDASAAIAALRGGDADAGGPTSTDPNKRVQPDDDRTDPPKADDPDTPGSDDGGDPPSAAPTPNTPPKAAPGAPAVGDGPALALAASGDERWPSYTLPLGLALAVGAGLVGPMLRMRSRLTLRGPGADT